MLLNHEDLDSNVVGYEPDLFLIMTIIIIFLRLFMSLHIRLGQSNLISSFMDFYLEKSVVRMKK